MLHVIQLTPPGRGAVATLRIEGPGAVDAVQSGFQAHGGRPLTHYSPDQIVVGHFGGEQGEEVVVRRCTDDAVELHCHGGLAAVAAIEDSLVSAGCRRLAWRDWISSRHGQSPCSSALGRQFNCHPNRSHDDAISASALAALADARTERTASILLDQYHGALGREREEIRQAIDRGEMSSAKRRIDALLARAELGQHLIRPWSVVLAGRPNVGKSSLMNALAGYDRAIVHPSPGTTRDAVTLVTAIDGWPVELCDTAGLRSEGDVDFSPLPLGEGQGVRAELANDEALTLTLSQGERGHDIPITLSQREREQNMVERAGIQLAQDRLAGADLVVLVSDRNEPWSATDQALVDQWPKAVLVHNKCDLSAATTQGDSPIFVDHRCALVPAKIGTVPNTKIGTVPRPTGLSISALRGDGVEELLEEIARRLVHDPPPPGAAVPFTAEQTEMIRQL